MRTMYIVMFDSIFVKFLFFFFVLFDTIYFHCPITWEIRYSNGISIIWLALASAKINSTDEKCFRNIRFFHRFLRETVFSYKFIRNYWCSPHSYTFHVQSNLSAMLNLMPEKIFQQLLIKITKMCRFVEKSRFT